MGGASAQQRGTEQSYRATQQSTLCHSFIPPFARDDIFSLSALTVKK
jgi:hypothetical protein